MTSQKQFKSRVRSRMAKTGERYAVARRHLVAESDNAPSIRTVVDHGWALRGGTDPDASALANLLANQGVLGPNGPLSEPVLFGITGGIGAGYILWEFKHDDSRHVTLGFNHRWNYLEDRLRPATERLGLDTEWRRTGSARTAAADLRRELTGGTAMVIWPDRYHVGYRHLLPWLEGHGGHCVVAYAIHDDRVHLDDRNVSTLTVPADALDRARARVGSYQNASLVVRSRDRVLDGDTVRTAVRAGLESTVGHLSSGSESFSLPTWRKWSRLLVDRRNIKAWPKVFADRRSVLAALVSVWEGVSAAGMTGGNLRGLYAEFLEEAGDLLSEPALGAAALRWREIADLWQGLADAATPADVPELGRARELTATVTGAVAEGDEGAADGAAAAEELWALRDRYAAAPPFEPERENVIRAAMSERLAEIFAAETAAITQLAAIIG